MVDRMKALEYLAGMLEKDGPDGAGPQPPADGVLQFLQSMNPGGEDGGE